MRYFEIAIVIEVVLFIVLAAIYLFTTGRNYKLVFGMCVVILSVGITGVIANIVLPAHPVEDAIAEKINQEQGVEATVLDDGEIEVSNNGKRCSYSVEVIDKPTTESSGMARLDGDTSCLPSHWHDDGHNHDSIDIHEHEEK